MRNFWSDGEIKWLFENVGTMPDEELYIHLNKEFGTERTMTSTIRKCEELGYMPDLKRKYWYKQHEEKFRELVQEMKNPRDLSNAMVQAFPLCDPNLFSVRRIKNRLRGKE